MLDFKDIFLTSSTQEKYRQEEIHFLPLNPSFIALLSGHLQITYQENDTVENTCFADSKELMADYRTTFSQKDVINYILIQMEDKPISKERLQIKMPENPMEFFKK